MEPYQRLEQEWAKFNDLDPAGMVACSSGTAALHLALEAFQLPPGSEVLVPDYTMVACPRAVVMAGLTPVFVDCDDRLLMDGSLMMNTAWSLRPAAIMVVHVYGRKFDFTDMLVEKGTPGGQDTWLIEDLAEAHGVRPHPSTDAACWSFFRNKIIAGEEGGAVWFRDSKHAALARQLRCLGFTAAHDYDHVPRGHNYRMSNLHAQPILYNLGQYRDSRVSKLGGEFVGTATSRREIESWYDAACPPEWRQPKRDAVWVYDLRVPGMTQETQDRAVSAVRALGTPARHGFKPMHVLEEFRGCRRAGGGNAELASREVIYLPVQPGVTTPETVRAAMSTIEGVVRTDPR